MGKITMVYPQKYQVGDAEIKFNELPTEIIPLAFATLDGKPSEQYEAGKSYVAASLITQDPNQYDYVFKRLTELYGGPLVKPASLRKKRRLKFLRKIVEIFIKMKSEPAGFPLNTCIINGFENSLNPRQVLDLYRASSEMQKKISIAEITDRHVNFRDGQWFESITHEQFGGIYFWTLIVKNIDEHITSKVGRPIPWCLLADNLPCDPSGRRMTILFAMLEEMFDSRLTLMFTKLDDGEADIPVDLLTDIYTSIAYEVYSPEGSNDSALNEAFRVFDNSALAHDVVLI